MFRRLKPRYIIPLVCVLFLSHPDLSGQAKLEVPDLRNQAMNYYEEGNYTRAGEAFAQLIRQFPRDAMYRYYAGICHVERSRNLDEAVELLYYASTRGVPEDVYYYLGVAYRGMYDFERAKKYFVTFDKEAPRSMARERDSKLLIRSVNTAIQLTSTYNPYDVQNVTFIDLFDPVQTKQIRMKGGNLAKKPELFFSEEEALEDLNAWMFMPKNLSRGQKVYFSGKERRGRDGYQIMQAERGNTGKWTNLKPIEALNTGGDEILPYFDPVGKDIYFASDGREGLGGFDLYRSHYDEVRDEWSEPVNLGFPVNSAFDDYLLLPGTDLGMVTFFSSRQGSDTAVAVYRVHLSEPKQSLASKTPKEIRKIANLGDVASEMIRDLEVYTGALAENEQVGRRGAGPNRSNEKLASGSAVKAPDRDNLPESARENLRSAPSADTEYQAMISAALKHQAATDSLTELSTAARVRVRESDDPNEKWLSQRQIMLWEKKAAEERELADGFFVQIEGYRENLPPSVIEKDTVINDITVYRYAENTPAEITESSRTDVEEKAKAVFSGGDQYVKEQPVASSRPKEAGGQFSEKNGKPLQQSVSGPAEGGENTATNNNSIPVDGPLPGGTLYRIQLGVYSNEVDPAIFGGITSITAMTDPDRNLIFYYAGNFKNYEEARDALTRVRSNGFADAFIVAWFNGAKMSIEKARKLEN